MAKTSTVRIERFIEDWRGTAVEIARVSGDTPDEIIVTLLPLIRSRSQDFYHKELRADLERDGSSHVDNHAGQGTYYRVSLNKQKSKRKRTPRSRKGQTLLFD